MEELEVAVHFSLLLLATIVFPWRSAFVMRGLIYILSYVLITIFADFFGAMIKFNIGTFKEIDNNLFIYHFLTVLQYFSIIGFYYFQIEEKWVKRMLILSLFIFLGGTILITIMWQPLSDYNSYASMLKYFFTILWTLYYLKEIIVRKFIAPILGLPGFWITAGFLINSLGNLFVEGAANYLISTYGNYFDGIYFIYTLLSYLLFLTFVIGFWLARVKPKDVIPN